MGDSGIMPKKATDPKLAIRRDIFSVKVLSDGRWCHTRMFYSRPTAVKWRDGERLDRNVQSVKLVHPAQFVVDAYLAYGNTIYD